jgi:dihydrodipicolinate synthase/N-acetylneuraminate lyase
MNGLDQRICEQSPLNIVLYPSPGRGRNRLSESVVTNGCKRDTVRGGAIATGMPHSLGSGLINFEDSIRRRSVIHSGWRWP